MRHRKRSERLGKTSSHREAMLANMTKALVMKESIETTLPKAKVLRRYADRAITLAKENTLSSRRSLVAKLRVRFNELTTKEARAAKNGDKSSFNDDRFVIEKLMNVLGPRFKERNGGYTRIIKTANRIGDDAQMCVIQYLEA
ncbi:50S ribosomal protein L17 [bacterium]|jgi:large subunit ribosomal protein L17|nr:50S ribosomal protein L17 [Chlamydiota bacterium]NDD99667.1 50S ribosomal protein L17 [bacterium]